MQPLKHDDYSHFRTTPVTFEPWQPRTRLVAAKLLTELRRSLHDFDAELLHTGSTALEIDGKNDIEICIFPTPGNWLDVFEKLKQHYGAPGYESNDFIRFDARAGGFAIEIIQLRGYIAKVNKAVHHYLLAHPDLCEEYVAVKRKYSYSKREYQIHKDLFFDRLMQQIPEDYIAS